MRSLPPRGFNAPIVVKEGYYSYEDPDFSIDNTPLNETDIETINNAITLLSQFSKLPIYEELAVVKEKLSGEALQYHKHTKVIDFEQREVKGSEHLAPLFKAINGKKSITLVYQSFKAIKPTKSVVYPYLLKQYNHRWYLVGLSKLYNKISVYSLDRIVSFEPSTETYVLNTLLEPDTYFTNIIGITIPGEEELQMITLLFNNEQKPYILTKPIHRSQQVLTDDQNGLKITVRLIPNYEFYSLVLGFGENVEIIEPVKIRNLIKARLMAAGNKYAR
jgi:predicted DNA-binding transcriptional regulator YafY